MAAEVAGTRKRGAAAFLDDPFEVLQVKRGRCSPRAVAAAVAVLDISMEFDSVEALQSVFPDTNPQLLRGYLEAPGNILDATIRSFRGYLALDLATTNAGTSSSGG